ncbi:MAG: glycosyltransferase [Methanolinea sp.]|nr:glycosyltransferase [Methanolinea sp.]
MPIIQLSDLPPPEKGQIGWPWTEVPSCPSLYGDTIYWPKISIITPSYNQGEYIEETIRSVLLQGYPNLEYIVIDGGSTDNTIEILKKYSDFITYWRSEPDNGQTNAINKGLKLCRGDIIAYLNSDDRYEPNAFFVVARYFQEHKNVRMIYGNIIHIDKNSQVIEKVKCKHSCDFERLLSLNFYIAQPTVFFRREVFEKIGYFDEKLNLAMDTDYWLRVSQIFSIGFIDYPIAAFRLYPETKSASRETEYLEEFLLIFEKIFSQETLSKNYRLKSKTLSSIYLSAARINLPRGNLQKSRELFLRSLKIYPLNFLSPLIIGCYLSALLGKKFTKFSIRFKRGLFEKFNFLKRNFS